jgi:hypothetical protein
MESSACRSSDRPIGNRSHAAPAATVFLILLLAGGGPAVAGQDRIGLHAGLSIPSLRGGDSVQSEGFESRKAPFFGVFAEFPVTRHLSLCPELNYASQGGQRNGMQPLNADQLSGLPIPPGMTLYADFRNKAIIDYVEIPVTLKASWGHKVRYFVGAGPTIGIRVRAKTVTRGTSPLYIDPSGTPLTLPPDNQPLPPVSFDADTDIKEDINPTSGGIAGLAGVEVPFGPGNLVFDVRFSAGLTNIQKHPEIDGKNRTGAAVVSVGYSFGL